MDSIGFFVFFMINLGSNPNRNYLNLLTSSLGLQI